MESSVVIHSCHNPKFMRLGDVFTRSFLEKLSISLPVGLPGFGGYSSTSCSSLLNAVSMPSSEHENSPLYLSFAHLACCARN